jgi:hypothetical protein
VRGWQFKLGSAWFGIILLIAFAAYREIELVVTKLKIPFADDQTAIFEEFREKLERADSEDAAKYLGYFLNYYPSGTKQVPGSPLDRVVERARRNA